MHAQPGTEFSSLIEAKSSTSHEGNARTKQSLWYRKLWHGWRRIVFVGVVCNILVFLLNCSFLAWAASCNWIIWEGSYASLEQFNTLFHLMINIISTVILTGSNSVLQILLAPTRKDIDQAHFEKRFLDIGISSLHNWHYLPWKRRLLYTSILITTLPIHLLYNSIIVPIIATVEFENKGTGLVTKDFLQIPPNNSSLHDLWLSASRSSASNSSVSNWTRKNVSDCPNDTQTGTANGYANVLFFTNLTAPSQNASWHYDLQQSPEPCGPFNISINSSQISDTSSSVQRSWIAFFDDLSMVETKDTSVCRPCATRSNIDLAYVPAEIEYCLVQRSQLSKVELIPQLLIILMACNLLRIFLSSILLFSNLDPLITIGDTIASFLDTPDSTTRYIGPISATTLQKQLSTLEWPPSEAHVQHEAWKVHERHYTDTVTPLRWGLTLGFCIVYIFAIIALLILAPSLTSSSDLQFGFGNVIGTEIAKFGNISLLGLILLINTPQLALSSTYLGYNALFTCMLLSKEWLGYSKHKHKKSLRVTNPRGKQRGTYFLSLPYKYSVPIALKNVLLQWVLSQSTFSVRVDTYVSDLIPAVEDQYYIGISQKGLMLSAILAAVSIVAPVYFGKTRLGTAMPLVRSNSLAISAACQPDAEGLSVKELRYGVISELPSGRYRVGFSDKEVKPMIQGQFYE